MPRDIVEVGIVGDYQSGNVTHESVAPALAHHLGTAVRACWVPTEAVREEFDARRFDGLWIAPGSPYRSMTGALTAVRSARDYGVPLLGTCGGFQHVVIEFARNVAGFVDAQHAEYDPYGSQLFITPLSCSLVGQTMSVDIARTRERRRPTAGSRRRRGTTATLASTRSTRPPWRREGS